MKNFLFSLGLILCIFYSGYSFADCRGCCSHHGGVVCGDGVTMCADGTSLSAKCRAKGCNKCYSSLSSSKPKTYEYQSSTPQIVYSNSSSVPENKWYGRVLAVVDGDTINVMHDGKPEKIRLYGIDTPEKKPKIWK